MFMSLIIVQVFLTLIILSISPQSKSAFVVRHAAKTVLGISTIADDTSDVTPTNIPTDTPTPTDDTSTVQTQSSDSTEAQPQDTLTNTPAPSNTTIQSTDNSQADQNILTPTTNDSNTSNLQPAIQDNTDQSLLQDTSSTNTQEDISPTNTQSDEANLARIPTDQQMNLSVGIPTPFDISSQDSTSDTAESIDIMNPSTNNAVLLDPQSVIISTSSVNDAVVSNVTSQDTAINNDSSSEQKVSDLQTFVKDNVTSINNQIIHNNFASTALLSQQLSNQLDQLSANISKLPPISQNQAVSKVYMLCNKANTALKIEAMVVPEDLKQDFIMNQAKCHNLSL